MSAEANQSGAEVLLRALKDQGVEVIFGYPGGAVLPIYDALFKQNAIRHILVRQEGGAVHAAEGYARSTGKVGVVLVTSGPGATNAVTGLCDALMDCIPRRLPDRPGADPPDRQRRLPGGRHHRHHPPRHQAQLPGQAGRGSGARGARGVLRRPLRPSRPGGDRPAEGHRHRQGALRAAGRAASELPPADRARRRPDRQGDRAAAATRSARWSTPAAA